MKDLDMPTRLLLATQLQFLIIAAWRLSEKIPILNVGGNNHPN